MRNPVLWFEYISFESINHVALLMFEFHTVVTRTTNLDLKSLVL
ncbi:hypothetical protein RSAG8_02628, partial [Rhizoctonia solani AG-8 WAC10335]